MRLIFMILFSLTPHYILAELEEAWWKHATTYEIFVMSFKDSDGDGIGDIAGITSKLDYLYELGIRVLKLSSIYSSPDNISPNYYGVDDFKKVHRKLGSLEDFDELMTEAKRRDIKIVLEIDLNHCHSTHEWFQKSVDGIEPFKNYFVWKDPVFADNSDIKNPPNSWFSRATRLFTWTWMEKRHQFYYSSFNPSLPDFNLYDQGLKEELKNILRFWLDKGVSGFNIKNKYYYFEDTARTKYKFTYPQLEDTYEFLRELRDFVDIYNGEVIDHQRILITDRDTCDSFSLRCVGNKDYSLVHVVSNRALRYLRYYDELYSEDGSLSFIESYLKFSKVGVVYEWQIDDIMSSIGSNSEDQNISHLAYTMGAVLPGVWHLFYGSEIGLGGYHEMTRIHIENDFNYNYEYTPAMQWDDSKYAGFSDSNHPMYQPMPNYWKINAERMKNEENSLYHFFKNLLEVRQKRTMELGDVKIHKITEYMFAIVRTLEGYETYITVIQLSNLLQPINLNNAKPTILNLASRLRVVAASPNCLYQKGYQINSSRFTMRPFSSVVLKMENLNH